MAIQRTPARGYPYPEVTDKPLVASRDFKDLATSLDTDMSGVAFTAERADTVAAEALALAQDAGSPLSKLIIVKPTPPVDKRVLWIDTSGLDPDDGGGVDPAPDPGGQGYVGQLAALSPYTTLAVSGADDAGDVVSYDVTASGGGKTITTRVQGDFVEGTGFIDGYQRIEEITTGDGYLMGPRSNMEWATQYYASTTANSGAQFSPYHGSTTALAWQVGESTATDLDGSPISLPAQGASTALPNGLAITQTVQSKHPSYTGSGNQLEVTTTTSFHPDGMIEVSGTWKALVDLKVGAVYAPMTPFQLPDITELEHAGGTVVVDNTVPSSTTNQTLSESVTSGVFRSASRPDLRIAWAFTDPTETLRLGEPDQKTVGDILFIQRRTDGINKLYRHVWASDTVVAAGTEYNFGAQWRYMEAKVA